MPLAFEQITLRSEMTDNSADFVYRESCICGDCEVIEPEAS
jgi:hypothetical protein